MIDTPPVSTAAIAVFDQTSGALIQLGPAGSVPAGKGWVALPAGYSPDLWSWSISARVMVEDAVKVEAQLIAAVNAERETRQMLVMTTGGAKKAIYAMQQAEVLAWQGLGIVGATTTQLLAAFNLLPLSVRKQKFYFAMMSAARRGEASIAPAIQRFVDGAAASNREVARIEAIARAAIDAIKAGATVAAKRAAFAAVNWNWQPASI